MKAAGIPQMAFFAQAAAPWFLDQKAVVSVLWCKLAVAGGAGNSLALVQMSSWS